MGLGNAKGWLRVLNKVSLLKSRSMKSMVLLLRRRSVADICWLLGIVVTSTTLASNSALVAFWKSHKNLSYNFLPKGICFDLDLTLWTSSSLYIIYPWSPLILVRIIFISVKINGSQNYKKYYMNWRGTERENMLW